MLSHKISGLPVTDAAKLVGFITTSYILRAFLDAMCASEEGSSRIDFVLEPEHDLTLASKPSSKREEKCSALARIGTNGTRSGYVTYTCAPQIPIISLMRSEKKDYTFWASKREAMDMLDWTS